ncbi:MAG: hypothetical protein M5U28_44080 [Sandaracinaceae bacterium]|nr:hypothetical protein [Sandaracinaceae bacterium]
MTQPLHVVRHASAAGSHSSPAPQVGVPASQRSALSLQASTPLQATPSEQLRAVPAQVAAVVQASLTVQKRPSSQVAPVAGVHAVADVAGAQIWHRLAGLAVPGA